MNLAAARLARAACDKFSSADKPRFVAGALGPTPRTASISPDVNDPAARNVTFDELRTSYFEQAHALLEGGCDLFLVETIFDTLNAKAAIFALDELMEQTGQRIPVIVSGTVTDASGRILSGQTVSAFWNSVRHARPLAVGLNCAMGAALMRPYLEELSKVASDVFLSCYPNAGLPNAMSETGFDEAPEVTGALLEEFARAGFLNIAGGCCGTTPTHIKLISTAIRADSPRQTAQSFVKQPATVADLTPAEVEVVDPETRSNWSRKVARGEFVTSVEVLPPKGCDAQKTLDSIRLLKEAHRQTFGGKQHRFADSGFFQERHPVFTGTLALVAGIDARPARRLNLAGFAYIARIMNVVQAREHALAIARRRERHVAIHRIEKRHHLGDRLDDVTVAIEDPNAFRHDKPPKNCCLAIAFSLSQSRMGIKGAGNPAQLG